MKLTCAGDYKLQEEWLEKHKLAHNIVYDKENNLPVCAIYVNPIYQAYVSDIKNFFKRVNIEIENI